MISPEVQPFEPEAEPLLTIGESNGVQFELVNRSGLSPEQWVERYAVRYRVLVDGSPTPRKLVRQDWGAALEAIETRLRDDEALH